jgi:hypothetical protein
VNVTSANFAGNGGSAAVGEGEAPGVGVVAAPPSGEAPAFSFEDLFWQEDVKSAAEIMIKKVNRKIISVVLSSFRKSP